MLCEIDDKRLSKSENVGKSMIELISELVNEKNDCKERYRLEFNI